MQKESGLESRTKVTWTFDFSTPKKMKSIKATERERLYAPLLWNRSWPGGLQAEIIKAFNLYLETENGYTKPKEASLRWRVEG